jgi:hypothetical protein
VRVQLFGVGTKSESWAITAQRRINCFAELRKEPDRTEYALVGRPGLDPFISSLGVNPSRGLWAVNTLTQPLLFTVHGQAVYSINNSGVVTAIGTLLTSTGPVSMADDGKFLVIVDGANGYVYNMSVPAGVNRITDGNFTTTPEMVTWQDSYFIVTSGTGRQFQLSQITPSVDPTIWPAIQINFAGSGAGSLQGCMSDHSILNLFGDVYTEFWQNQGTPDFPFALIPGSSQEFGLNASFSLAKFDNSVVGLFRNKMGGVQVARLQGFNLQKISDHDIDEILGNYMTTTDALGFGFMFDGHPMYLLNLPTGDDTWMYDGLTNVWSEVQASDGTRFWGQKFALFQNKIIVADYRSGALYVMNPHTNTDSGSILPMEIWSKHIWNDDKFLGINDIQIDVQSGVGLVTGQGSIPVMDLQVSKDGGNTFFSVGYSSMGQIGEYTQRVKWRSLGAARDWVLKLRITDPVQRVITGASAEITVAGF